MDIVLTEGFKKSSMPKIELHRKERSATLLCRGEEHDPTLLAVASDEPLGPGCAGARPERCRAVADFIEREISEMSDPGSQTPGRSKIWLEVDGEPVFGQGREELLRLIQKTGSINAAAKAMGIPYRKAWTYIDAMEKRLGFPLVNRQKGGSRRRRIGPYPAGGNAAGKIRSPAKRVNDQVNSKFIELDF